MGMYGIIGLVVFALLTSLVSIQRLQANSIVPPVSVSQAQQEGQAFVGYCRSVARYMQNNPTFTGTVSNAMLSAQGTPVTSSLLSSASNAVTVAGTSGRLITCWAKLSAGAINAALAASGNDASLGLVSGTTWTAFVGGGGYTPAPVALAVAVPNGDVVSVIQIGS